MVVVPALAHGQQGNEAHVVPLHRSPLHLERDLAVIVREVTDQPMPEHARRDSRAESPAHESGTAERIQRDRQRHVLSHPCALEKHVESIGPDSWLDADRRWTIEHEVAVELPPSVAQRLATVPKVVVAARQALREVAQIVLLHEPDRPREPDMHAAVDEEVLEPLGALERVVHELAMVAERMSQQEHGAGRRDVERERGP
jgi:hypothetical protein